MSHTIWRTCIALVSLTRTRFACSQKLHRNLPNTEKNNLIKNHTEPILLSCTKFEKKPKQFGLCKSTKVPLENLSKHNRHIPDYSNFFLFDCWCSHKQYLQMLTTRTRFAGSQKLPNRKSNSTEVFLAVKRTSMWKIIPNWLCYWPQNPKNQLGSFDKFTNGHLSLCFRVSLPLHGVVAHSPAFWLKLEVTPPDVNS